MSQESNKNIWRFDQNDFGRIPNNTTKEFKFELSDDSPYTIKSVRATCGCTDTKHTKTSVTGKIRFNSNVKYMDEVTAKKIIRVTLIDKDKKELKTVLNLTATIDLKNKLND